MLSAHPQALFITAILAAAHPSGHKNQPPAEPTPPAIIQKQPSTLSIDQRFQDLLSHTGTLDLTGAFTPDLPKEPSLSDKGPPLWDDSHFMQFKKIDFPAS